ncbi:NnrU protein [Musa troglodytarum]|uniref:NnrU protein n=1 Tax=Musa troglodytarum TaxID=320322 RepID=A0A9E7IDA7_9LILI|nr:NnrU protein [Musa troglodytarum]
MASPLLLSISTPFGALRRRYLYPHNIAAPPLRYPSSLAFLKPFQSRNFWGTNSSNSLRLFGRAHARGTPIGGAESETSIPDESRVGEDSAAFELGEQKLSSWAYFTAILGAVLLALNVLWINPATGFGTAYIDAVSGLSPSPEPEPVHQGQGRHRQDGIEPRREAQLSSTFHYSFAARPHYRYDPPRDALIPQLRRPVNGLLPAKPIPQVSSHRTTS